MIQKLNWYDINTSLPDVNKTCLCYTSNNKYFISEVYHPHDGKGNIIDYGKKTWKGSNKTVNTITHWAYLED